MYVSTTHKICKKIFHSFRRSKVRSFSLKLLLAMGYLFYIPVPTLTNVSSICNKGLYNFLASFDSRSDLSYKSRETGHNETDCERLAEQLH